MKNRIQEVYLALGQVLNNPGAFGLGPRAPSALEDALIKMRRELMDEIKEEMSGEDFLTLELSQDADRLGCREIPAKLLFRRKTGT